MDKIISEHLVDIPVLVIQTHVTQGAVMRTQLIFYEIEIGLHSLDTIDEYYEVGQRMKICVGSSMYYLKPNTLVFIALVSNKQVATIDIDLSDNSIIQCRAFANGVCEYQDRIAKIISDNSKQIEERKTA